MLPFHHWEGPWVYVGPRGPWAREAGLQPSGSRWELRDLVNVSHLKTRSGYEGAFLGELAPLAFS